MNNRFVFFGTPDVSVTTLDALYAAGYVPSLIVTAPDRPSGRGMKMTPPLVKVWADEHGIEAIQPEKIDDEFIASLAPHPNPLPEGEGAPSPAKGKVGMGFDLFIVIAYGKILPEKLIHMPRLGTINIHYSLLPRWRGASPVEAAILAGDTETGVSIQQMVYQLDAGDVIAEARAPIGDDETAPELRVRLGDLGAELLVETLPKIFAGDISPMKQNEGEATKCGKFSKADAEIHPKTDDPIEMWRKYRAYFAWPKAWFMHGERRHKVTAARFQDGKFIIERVIPEGEKETPWY